MELFANSAFWDNMLNQIENENNLKAIQVELNDFRNNCRKK